MSSPGDNQCTAWAVNPFSWRDAQRLADSLGLPPVAAMVLAGRGLTDPGQARTFLDCTAPIPDPFLFGHMEAAVHTISAAIDRGTRLVVHGDYDADGITATALMVLGLRELGARVEWYLPSRFNEGFGLSREAVTRIAGEGPGVLLTVDCGVNYPEEVALARERGMEVVVVDHHQPGPQLPECHVIHEAVGPYPHGDLCGVGLALKVMHALHVHSRGAQPGTLPDALQQYLDLVAIGSIADLAPLRGENRFYVKEGLKLLGIGRRVGLRALTAVAGCTGGIDSGAVAYRLAPRLNAAGRLADPTPPLRLLLTDDEEEARVLAAQLHELNGARQDVERQILERAVAGVEALGDLPPVIVLAEPGWHEGVVGIVASRLVERYHRPAILLGLRDGVAKGSGRSIAAYDLMDGLNYCAGHLTIYGGHKQAAGLTLEAGRVAEFRTAIHQHAGECLKPGDLVPVYHADAVLRGEDISADTAVALAALGPFGAGNPKPRLLLVDAGLERAETTRGGAHLRCTVSVDGVKIRGIGFGLGGACPPTGADAGPLTLGAQFHLDEWQGTLRPELQVERMEACGSGNWTEEAAAGSRRPANPGEPGGAARSGLGPAGAMLRMPACRDLRDRRGRASAVAQVLGAGEGLTILTCSAAWTLQDLGRRLPVQALAGDLACLTRDAPDLATGGDGRERNPPRTRLVEWDAAASAVQSWPAHVVAVDPPYRPEHVALLHQATGSGSVVHLVYGEEQRQDVVRFLRYTVHPRFAMVCLYRAMQEQALAEAELLSRAAESAWEEARVSLSAGDLLRAKAILAELGVRHGQNGEAKLDARRIAVYAAAETEYEECSRLCLSL